MTINRRGGFLLLLIFLFSGCQSGAESDASSDDEETTPVPVETARPTRGDVHAVYTGTAPVEAFAEAEVVAKVAGEVRT
ncbi:MAG: hypothetical protein KJO82_04940, partial [Gammaproteobacteria bacterium]|nr:hypothetical protein [Gammaproteobacteria bacterium]